MHRFGFRSRLALTLLAIASPWDRDEVRAAESITFGGNAHGLSGHATAALTAGSFQMTLSAGPAGAILNENHGAALGVDSRGVAGGVDVGEAYGIDKVNVLGGVPGVAGQSETVTFSFNRGGVLRGLLLDGVKDETLEYFQLQLPNGSVRTLFDFEVELRLTQQGFSLATLAVPGLTLLDGPEDDATGLNIPFQAGDAFVLSYGEFPYPGGYVPLTPDQPPNGARWQGLLIVPEPAGVQLAAVPLAALLIATVSRRTRRTARPLAA